MIIINITVLIQVILTVFSIYKWMTLKKIQDEIMYWHEKKSFQDIYRMNVFCLIANIIIIYFGAIISNICREQGTILTTMHWYWLWGTRIFALVMMVMVSAISVYMTTEIKHISPDDGIGFQIADIEDKKTRIKAKRFYITEAIVGMLVIITTFIQLLYLHIFLGIAFILIVMLLYFGGMADVLQHENYNSPEYKERYKKMKWANRYFFTNIFSLFSDREYRNKACNALLENTSNIKKGVKNIFKH